MPARRTPAAGCFAGRPSLLCKQRLRAALGRRPRPEALRGLAASEPGKSVPGGERRGVEAAESAGGYRESRPCAPVPGEKRSGRRVAGTGGCASSEAPRGADRLSQERCLRPEGKPSRPDQLRESVCRPAIGGASSGTGRRDPLGGARLRGRGSGGEVAAEEGSPASSTGDRTTQELRQQLTRKQWRNRRKNKRRQNNKFKASSGRLPASSVSDNPPDDQGGLTPDTKAPDRQTPSLRQRLESRLDAARFRYINQLLYTRSSREAAQLFQEDPEALAVYHRGFALQAARWPERPVERFVHYLHHRPASLVVADFGCGDCSLARSLPNRVHCFDLAALDPRVTVCDMAQVPLEDASVDVAVFCLALMGTNLREILQEAHRVLRVGGTLLVAEVASRFADLRAFLGALARLGFRLISKDVSGSHFYTFELRKNDQAEAAKAAEEPRGLVLRPCLYKRR